MLKIFKRAKKPSQDKRGLTYMLDGKGIIILDTGTLTKDEINKAVERIKSKLASSR